jgi:hypothetical protein
MLIYGSQPVALSAGRRDHRLDAFEWLARQVAWQFEFMPLRHVVPRLRHSPGIAKSEARQFPSLAGCIINMSGFRF